MKDRTEYWVALIAAAIYVFQRSSDKPLVNRLVMTGVSAGLGYSLTPDLTEMTGRPEILTLVLATTMIYLALDFLSALVSDRALLLETVKRWVRK